MNEQTTENQMTQEQLHAHFATRFHKCLHAFEYLMRMMNETAQLVPSIAEIRTPVIDEEAENAGVFRYSIYMVFDTDANAKLAQGYVPHFWDKVQSSVKELEIKHARKADFIVKMNPIYNGRIVHLEFTVERNLIEIATAVK